jgi:serine/threonine-protein kinase
MGTVHVGRWRGATRAALVAVKRMHPHLVDDPATRRGMLAEADISMRVRHPNVVAAYDMEDLGSELLLVMEYIEGAALSELLQAAPLLPEPLAIRIVLDAAAGLAAVHALCDEHGVPMGLVHRDVAPDNILVGLDGRARIADFGVATTAATRVAEAGVLKGRFAYMAPEYLMSYVTDARADVFSLGVVAWELLSGRTLFKAATDSATMQRVMRLEPPRLSSIAPELGTAFDQVFEKVLAKNPAHRYADVDEFATALGDAATRVCGVAGPAELSALVDELAGEVITRRRAAIDQQLTSPQPLSLRERGSIRLLSPAPLSLRERGWG